MARARGGKAAAEPDGVAEQAAAAIAWLRRRGSKAGRDGMARFALPSDKAFGVSVGEIQSLAKKLGKSHALAGALWATEWHEARMLASYVDEPAEVTAAQMDRWAGDFDNWGICDTLCFVLFDRAPHAWKKVDEWSAREDEFVKRAGLALLWSLSVHDKDAPDTRFLKGLAIIEREAQDERHFVKKAANMALRAIGKRNAALHKASVATATRLAVRDSASARWIGKDALRELRSPSVARRIAR